MVRTLHFGSTLRGEERVRALGNTQETGTTRGLGVGKRAARALQGSSTTATHPMGMRVSEEMAE